MADMNNSNGRNTKEPALIAWHVSGKGEQSFWHRVGAAWDHKDGRGVTLVLDTLPVNGRVVLREPKLA